MKNTLEMKVKCPVCGWQGTVGEAEQDVDGKGSPGCPRCLCNVVAIDANLKRTEAGT